MEDERPARILVTGDRHWDCVTLARGILTRLIAQHGPNLTIVHGAARGVDRSFALAAQSLGITHEPHPVTKKTWATLGKGAGPRRNRIMVSMGATTCLVLHRNLTQSKGSRDCARQALHAGIPTYLVDSELGIPVRLHPHDPRLATKPD